MLSKCLKWDNKTLILLHLHKLGPVAEMIWNFGESRDGAILRDGEYYETGNTMRRAILRDGQYYEKGQ